MTIAPATVPSSVLPPDLVDRYLARLGMYQRPTPTLETLLALQDAHVLSIPFENLDYHYGREILLDERVVSKIVDDNRGGGCYELNPAFHYLLQSLGFDSRILPARSYVEGKLGLPFMHLVLEVAIKDKTYLVDTGFRRNARHPLDLSDEGEQPDPHGNYRLQTLSDGQVDVFVDQAPLYRFDRRGATIEDFGPTLWWWRTSPESPFLRDIFCSLPTIDGRVSLVGDSLTITTHEGRSKYTLRTEEETLAALRDHFHLQVNEMPNFHSGAGEARAIRFD